MINFRFHLVSLIAVFLALALGVLMGATVIDQAIVDGLRNRIDSVEDQADEERTQNSELREEVERLQRFVGDEFAVADTFEDEPVAVIAPRGVDGEDARGAVDLLQTAGATAPGVLWLEEKFQLEDEEARDELADILGVSSDGAEALRSAAWDALVRTPELIPGLVEGGFVEFDAVGEQGDAIDAADYPIVGARTLLLDQWDASDDAAVLVESLMNALLADGVPVVLGEVYHEEEEDESDGPARGARLVIVRDDAELRATVSTVDNLELTEGKVATVRALADLPERVGHYGLAPDVDAALPTR